MAISIKLFTMITLDKLKIFYKYHGDGGMWVRLATPKEKNMVTYEDWKLIDSLIEDLTFIRKGVASEEYISKIHLIIKENFDNNETREYLTETVLNLSK